METFEIVVGGILCITFVVGGVCIIGKSIFDPPGYEEEDTDDL